MFTAHYKVRRDLSDTCSKDVELSSSCCSEGPVSIRMKRSYPKDSWCLSAESIECLTI